MGADQDTFSAVDAFVEQTVIGREEALDAAVEATAAAGLPQIQVSPPQGKLLAILVQMLRARTVLEFGTLGGYSTIWLARALAPGGRLISLEADPGFAEVARGNVERAGLSETVEIRVGPALEALPALAEEDAGPFDLTFIDADKANTPNYFSWALDHSRPGSVIVADNVVRDGALADPNGVDEKARAQRHLHEILGAEPRVAATTIQTVGGKGYDGFLIARVN